ncbi:arsenate reductase (glutaredoxin) [Wenzhouxiangella sediminis]|uniref:Arsenate reductase n=1 Tax=Wenzhouxiangella sediminis TaxID=1792836 RepID=A0A3E1K8F8_9GAMM|nr:arsenate reductase (glutaredoxin) [Wenzhouxiangella sediminis]RFF30312.1 arsenate reductase (glutaredoxin) [Wenzhouxiangella sediminis]
MSITIYHNPRCSKSRQTLALIREHGIEPGIVEYLKQPPTPDELKRIIQRLDVPVREVIRSGEAEYRELGLGDESLDDAALIEAICAHPKLLQRPIVVHGDKARIGRPPEAVEDILS